MDKFQLSQKPIVLSQSSSNMAQNGIEFFGENLIIPPMNTDVRFGFLPIHQPSDAEMQGFSVMHPCSENVKFPCVVNQVSQPTWSESVVQDESTYLPWEHEHRHEKHEKGLHVYQQINENFSWAVKTQDDSNVDKIKKSIIHKVSSQHACGSCWAVCFADSMSDCLVVSGAVGWSPNISPTFLMSFVPSGGIHNMCLGGNPAAVAKYVEGKGLVDTSCIDYSWCSGDENLCKSVSSAQHFDAKVLGDRLNANIPKPPGCYFGNIKKWLYKLDSGTDVLNINDNMSIAVFRNTARSHILDYGPIIGGFVVLKNFITGNFTNFNGGVYFDRADYNNYNDGPLNFNNNIPFQVQGLHAVSIVGFGVAKNIQYDNDKFGDVPFWHCRNSWGSRWGDNGYFKIAMFPFNQTSQFDKQVSTELGNVGSMILIRATKRPEQSTFEKIRAVFFDNINRLQSDDYYKADADKVRLINRKELLKIDTEDGDVETKETKKNMIEYWLLLVVLLVVFVFVLMLLARD